MTFSSAAAQHQTEVSQRACTSTLVSPSIYETNEEMPIVAAFPLLGLQVPLRLTATLELLRCNQLLGAPAEGCLELR